MKQISWLEWHKALERMGDLYLKCKDNKEVITKIHRRPVHRTLQRIYLEIKNQLLKPNL